MNNEMVFKNILEIASQVNPDAFITGEVFFLPFFNNKFGPSLMPVDIEVLVHPEQVNETLEKLNLMNPYLRWHVIGTTDIKEYLTDNVNFIAFGGAVRLNKGQNEFVYAFNDTETHLSNGILQWNENRDIVVVKNEAEKWMDMFTGLSSISTQPANKVEMDWEVIEEKMKEKERGGKTVDITLSLKGEVVKESIMKWHASATKGSQMLLIPKKSKLPETDPWFAPDDEFREWIIDQFLTKYPQTPKDEYVQSIIKMQKNSDQKPSHLGWKVYQHSIFSALELDTTGFSAQDRRSMRLAIMWHDIGKCANVWTPGAHGASGAKLWKRYKPDFINKYEENRISQLIKAHDYLGLMDRVVKDEKFKGGISPQQIVDFIQNDLGEDFYYGLKLIKNIYLADIGSVATLRWLISLTPYLEELVIVEYENTKLSLAI